MARFALATGLRESNVLLLSWRQTTDAARDLVWISGSAAKAGKAIAVPLNADALSVLDGERDRHPAYVFTYQHHDVRVLRGVGMNVYDIRHYRFARQQPRDMAGLPWRVEEHSFARALRFAVPASVLAWAFIIGLCWEWL